MSCQTTSTPKKKTWKKSTTNTTTNMKIWNANINLNIRSTMPSLKKKVIWSINRKNSSKGSMMKMNKNA